MFDSLRARLIASFLFIILLTLCITGGGLLVLLQDYQRGIMSQRLGDVIIPIGKNVRQRLDKAPCQIRPILFRQVERPDYGSAMQQQLVTASETSGPGDLQALLESAPVWEVVAN